MIAKWNSNYLRLLLRDAGQRLRYLAGTLRRVPETIATTRDVVRLNLNPVASIGSADRDKDLVPPVTDPSIDREFLERSFLLAEIPSSGLLAEVRQETSFVRRSPCKWIDSSRETARLSPASRLGTSPNEPTRRLASGRNEI